ncbi:peptidylprolyl isomerase [Pelagibacterales bacterium SAG-MED20]|nr:peptidylprolyl isomerase [Pelagibacterales bacterium SAG-MED20]
MFIISTNINANANIKILYKINNEIITNIDIENEIKYLIALNNQLKKLNKKKIANIATLSIIKEKIKKSELEKFFILDQKNPLLNQIIKDFYIKLGMQNEAEFDKYLSNYNLDIKKLKKKIEIETTWNRFVFDKYNKQINIDIKSLKRTVEKNQESQKNTKYLLSEIIFEKKSNETFENKIIKIKDSINEIGFENTANTYSIADSSKFGGNIGWVDEINLSKKIINDVKNLKVGEITKPIQVGKNFLLLKLENKKEEKVVIDKNEMLKKLIRYEEERQLNQYSTILFNKVKINTFIDEL